MKKCVRCGKDMDVISRDPSKVFYCTKCSEELLNVSKLNEEKRAGMNKKLKLLCILIPGIYSLIKYKKYEALIYFLNVFIIPFVITIDLWSEMIDSINNKSYLFTIFIYINIILMYLKNFNDISKEEE